MHTQKAYHTAERFLESFINYEEKTSFPYRKALKLKRVEVFFDVLNIPYHTLAVVHIAGTKGKGSTAHFTAALLSSLGFKVGLYTSPHFFNFRERIQILSPQGRFPRRKIIAPCEVVRIVEDIRPHAEQLRFTKELGKLTFFEIYTAIAFQYFIEQGVDFAVIETGLGGRLDATNVLSPLLSILTHIGYDHTDKLGKTLSRIAYEKAGIIKRGAEVITTVQKRPVMKVIREKCRQMEVPLYILGEDFGAGAIRLEQGGSRFDFYFGSFTIRDIMLSMKGNAQVENATVSLAALRRLSESAKLSEREGGVSFAQRNVSELKKSLQNVILEGRFETALSQPLTILDIAHNVSSFLVLKENLKTYFPQKKIIFIFGVSKDKDVMTMLDIIPFSYLILTDFSSPRCFPPSQIKTICGLKHALVTTHISQAWEEAEKVYERESLILISGSLFLVAEAKRFFNDLSAPERKAPFFTVR